MTMRDPKPLPILLSCLVLVAGVAHAADDAGGSHPIDRFQARLVALELATRPSGDTMPPTPHDRALGLLAREARQGPLSVVDERRLIVALQNAGLLALADERLRRSIRGHRALRLAQARLWLERDRPRRALEMVSGLRPERHDDELRRLTARIDIRLGRWREARERLEAIKARTAMDDYLLARLWRDERPKRARDLLERAAGRRGDDDPARDRAGLELAEDAMEGRRTDAAIHWLGGLSRHGAEATRALYLLGLAEWQRGERHRAIRYWDSLRSWPPVDRSVVDALLALPYGLAEIGALDEAIERYRAARRRLERAVATIDDALSRYADGTLPADFPSEPAAIGRLAGRPIAPFLAGPLAGRAFDADWRRLAATDDVERRLRRLGDAAPADFIEAVRERGRILRARLAGKIADHLESWRRTLRAALNETRYGLARLLDDRHERGPRK